MGFTNGLGSEAIGGGLGVWNPTESSASCRHRWIVVEERVGEVQSRWGFDTEPVYRKAYCVLCGSVVHDTLDTRPDGCWHGRVAEPDTESLAWLEWLATQTRP